MDNLKYLGLMALGFLIFAPCVAFAGVAPLKVPEPSSLAVVAVGLGAAAILKFRKRK